MNRQRKRHSWFVRPVGECWDEPRFLWPYAGLNFGEHIRFEVAWQVVVQIAKLGCSPVVFAYVCVRGWAQQGHMLKRNYRRAFARVVFQRNSRVVLCSCISVGEWAVERALVVQNKTKMLHKKWGWVVGVTWPRDWSCWDGNWFLAVHSNRGGKE